MRISLAPFIIIKILNIPRCLLPWIWTCVLSPAAARTIMRGISMELLRRIFSVIGFDCMRRTTSTQRSASRPSLSQADGRDSRSQSCTSSLGQEQPHCQSCISYDAYFKQLSCGHMYCDSCMDHIVNLAFLDIEGLCEYPCPMCKSIRQLGLQIPESRRSAYSREDSRNTSTGTLQQASIEEVDEPGS